MWICEYLFEINALDIKMYGSVGDEKETTDQVPLVGFKNTSHKVQINTEFDPNYPFDERATFEDDGFWKEVR